MKKRRYITILLIILLIALCAVGSSDWIISGVVSFAPSLDTSAPSQIPVYINKVVEFDYGSYPDGVNLKDEIIRAVKFKNSAGETVDDISLSTNVLDENRIDRNISNGEKWSTLTIGNTYAYDNVYIKLSESGKYSFKGTYTEDGQNFTTQNVQQFQLLVKYQTVEIGSGSISTVSAKENGTETKINSFTSDSKWYTIEDALSNANATNKIVRVRANSSFTSLLDNVTGYSDENGRTIKSGVTLALPFDCEIKIHDNNRTTSSSALGNAKLKNLELTIPQDKTITNNGTISIGGSTTGGAGGQTYAGATSGDYAQITLGKNAKIDSYGDINAYGFIVEESKNNDSQVIMNSGTLLMPFIVMDHRGGSIYLQAHGGILGSGFKGTPFNRFFMQNVTSNLIIESDAAVHSLANLYAGSQNNITTIYYIGNTNQYFLKLESGSKSKIKYDIDSRITTWEIFGDAQVNSLSMKVSSYTVNTKDVLFPVSWYWNIAFKPLDKGGTSSVTSTSQSLKIMPGGVLTIEEGVTFNVPQIYVYDINFKEGVGPHYHDDKNIRYDDDGRLYVSGTLNVKNIGGYVDAKGDNAHLNISGDVKATARELDSNGNWVSEQKSLEGPIYCYNKNERGFLPKGNYTSLNDGWITDDSKFGIIYNFVYRDADGNEITPETEGNPNNQTFHTKEDLVLNDAVLDGYEFKGWYTNRDFAGATITTINGNTYYRETVTLYGLFEKLPEDIIQYTVDYKYNSTINGEEGTINILYSTDLESYKLIDLSRTGYTLEGWYKDNDFTTKVENLTEDDFVDNRITLYAKWDVKKYALSIKKASNMATFSVKVEYNSEKQEYTGDTTTMVAYGAKITITATPNNNYTLTITVTNNGVQSSDTEFTVNGDVTIKTETTSASGGTCLVEGTLVTLADGTQKKVEDLTYDDLLLTFNHLTGEFEASPMLVNLHAQDPSMFCRIIYLTFSDGTQIGVITEHAFFDLDANEYVYINEESVAELIGHRFVKVVNKNGAFVSDEVILNQYVVVERYVRRLSPVSIYINVVTEGLLSFTEVLTANGPTHGVINIIEFGENLKYDEVKMQEDIEKYGLYTYDDYKAYLTYEEFIYFPWAYFKVCVGKGRLTWDDILWNIQYIHNDRMEQMGMPSQTESGNNENAPQPKNVSTSNPLANVVIPPSTSSSSSGSNNDGSNDDDN